ncbi:MAG: hypothetical protein Q7S50_02935 [bacterium]|nr:hypothetical protein [bacterium]
MEKERANSSVSFLAYTNEYGFSAIFVTAAVSALLFVTALGWQAYNAIEAKRAATSFVASTDPVSAHKVDTYEAGAQLATSSDDGSSPIGSAILGGLVNTYAALQEQGLYTPEVGQKIAERMAVNLQVPISHKTYTLTDVKTDLDTSYARMLVYRESMQDALAPLLKNTELEFETFARYTDTKDPVYLEKLKGAAKNYFASADAGAKIIVPTDAASRHIAILNALQEFGTVLTMLADNANDPFASVALLRSYNQAESDVLASFQALVTYQKQKKS